MSRMDRYNKETTSNLRSNKNQELYKSIYELGEYSNIEGIATIDKSNEVDITKVKNMLKNRESYQQQKELRELSKKEPEVPKYDFYDIDESDKVYDIRDILTKAKVNKPTEENKSLDNVNFEILKELKEKHDHEEEKENVHEVLDEISNTSKLNKLSDSELGIDMFSDLQSNTIVESKEAIKSLLDEVKQKEEEKNANTATNIDKSFFSTSLNFATDDFEELKDLKKSVKKNNYLVRILVYVILLSVAGAIIYFVFNWIK